MPTHHRILLHVYITSTSFTVNANCSSVYINTLTMSTSLRNRSSKWCDFFRKEKSIEQEVDKYFVGNIPIIDDRRRRRRRKQNERVEFVSSVL